MSLHDIPTSALDEFAVPAATAARARVDHFGRPGSRTLAEECPVALVYNGSTYAVLMATPADLRDLALGFSLTENIIAAPSEIDAIDVVARSSGIELRIWLAATSGKRLQERRRSLIGPTGCGLCGIESLAAATRPVRPVRAAVAIGSWHVTQAVAALSDAQRLNHQTRATHAAGFYAPDEGLVLIREDVGRHNALDKLAGALAERKLSGEVGAIVLTSRVSVEMVQKAAAIGASLIIAISAPTALAVRTASACGMTVIAVVRGSAFEVFSPLPVVEDQ